jgi:hypothetical protein
MDDTLVGVAMGLRVHIANKLFSGILSEVVLRRKPEVAATAATWEGK